MPKARVPRPSPAQSNPSQPSAALPGPVQPNPAQPSPVQFSPAQPRALTACGGCGSAIGTWCGSASGRRCGCCGSSCSPSSACRAQTNTIRHCSHLALQLTAFLPKGSLIGTEFYLPVVRALRGLLPLFWLFFNGFGIHRHWRFLLSFYFSWGS